MGNKAEPPKVVTANELQTYIMIVKAKLTQQRNKKVFEITKKRKELINYIKDNNPEMAKLKMDGIIQEENYITAFDILGTIMEILKEKCTYLLAADQCPKDMRASLDTVIFASTRVEITEFSNIRDLITIKYGGAYVSLANNNQDKLVNKQIADKLTFAPNPEPYLISRIKTLCKEEEIDYTFPEEVIPIDFNKISNEGLGDGQQINFGSSMQEREKSLEELRNMGNPSYKISDLPTHSFIESTGGGGNNQGNNGNNQGNFGNNQGNFGNNQGNQNPCDFDSNFGNSQYFNQNSNSQNNDNNQNYNNGNFNNQSQSKNFNIQNQNYNNNSYHIPNDQSQVTSNFAHPNNIINNSNVSQSLDIKAHDNADFQNVNADFGGGPKYNVNMNSNVNNYDNNNNFQNSNNTQFNNNSNINNNNTQFNNNNSNINNNNTQFNNNSHINNNSNINNNSSINNNNTFSNQFNHNNNQDDNHPSTSFGTFNQSQNHEIAQKSENRSINDYSIFTPNNQNVVNTMNHEQADVHEDMFPSTSVSMKNKNNTNNADNGVDEFGFPEVKK